MAQVTGLVLESTVPERYLGHNRRWRPKTMKMSNWILAAILLAAAVFMYISVIVKTA